MKLPNPFSRRPGRVTRDPATRQPSGLRVKHVRNLSGGWDDAGIEGLAHEDGQAQLYTATWGEFNNEPRVVDANNFADATANALITQQLHGEVTDLETKLEAERPKFAPAENAVFSALHRYERAEIRVDHLEDRFDREEVEVPATDRANDTKEIGALSLLGSGDLVLNMSAFQLFGLSDKNFAFIPLSELALAASVTVFALMFLARCAGSSLKTFTHLLGALLFHRTDGEEDANRGRLARAIVAGSLSAFWLAAGIALLGAISTIRSSFLSQHGVDAHTTAFFIIQFGVFIAGVAMSFYFGHAYEAEWKRTCRHSKAVTAELSTAMNMMLGIVATYNGLIRQRYNLLAQYREWSLATTSDTRRQNELYARRVLLSQPEPTTDRLLPEPLNSPVEAAVVERVNKYLDDNATTFKGYEPLSIDKVEQRLRDIEQRREQRRDDRHQYGREVARQLRKALDLTAAASNGKHARTPA